MYDCCPRDNVNKIMNQYNGIRGRHVQTMRQTLAINVSVGRKLGFDVMAAMDCLNILLPIKDGKNCFKINKKEVQIQIAKCTGKRTKLEEDISITVKKISELPDNLALYILTKKMIDSKITVLQLEKD